MISDQRIMEIYDRCQDDMGGVGLYSYDVKSIIEKKLR